MDDAEKKLAEEYTKAGVDLQELKDASQEDTEEKSKEPEAKVEEKSDTEDAKTEPLQEQPKEQRKRSIYDVYKDEKSDRKAAEQRAEQAEKDLGEARRLLEEAKGAQGTKDEEETAEDAIAYAKKVGADPDLVKRIIEDARKGQETKTDPEMAKRLERFESWEKANSKVIETQMFNDEFDKTVPSLKKLFPTVNDDELKAIKGELDTLSHTREWHDKPLGYIAFEHQEKLTALISPKKRGMESRGRKEVEGASFDFEPDADLSSMTPKERAAWEKQYRDLTKNDTGLMIDAQGKRTLI